METHRPEPLARAPLCQYGRLFQAAALWGIVRIPLLAVLALFVFSQCKSVTARGDGFSASAQPLVQAASATVGGAPESSAESEGESLPDPPAELIGSSIDATTWVGKPRLFGRLQVFPVLSKKQYDVGPLSTLEAALAAQTAEVRELGAAAPEQETPYPVPVQRAVESGNNLPRRPARRPMQPADSSGRRSLGTNSDETGPSVGTLVIENRGDIPIYVLAGTVVKGGRQDRQIGQDFIVAAHSQSPIDAFCVEHGRWSPVREGQTTGGKFSSVKQLAMKSVRAAGQYKQNQGEVWAKVGEVNAAHRKSADSGTLMATLDDREVSGRRERLASEINQFLGQAQLQPWLVGYAYAIDGEVQGARWFTHRRVFQLFRDVLVNTVASEALTVGADQGIPTVPPPPPNAVREFIASVESSRDRTVRDTRANNVNEYAESVQAFGSKTMTKAAAKPARVISSDYLKK